MRAVSLVPVSGAVRAGSCVLAAGAVRAVLCSGISVCRLEVPDGVGEAVPDVLEEGWAALAEEVVVCAVLCTAASFISRMSLAFIGLSDTALALRIGISAVRWVKERSGCWTPKSLRILGLAILS